MKSRSFLPLLVSGTPIPANSTPSISTYVLAQDYSGDNFFNGFTFYTGTDPTNGHVIFADEETANSTELAGLIATQNSNSQAVYLGVDSTNIAPAGRTALRVASTRTFNLGLFIIDIAHMPGGVCGTWPAFWLLGTSNPWPQAGEIDIVEGVNSQSFNQMTLHTDAGVVVNNDTSTFAGEMVTSNCDVNAPGQDQNAGCRIHDQPSLPSFGTDFNANGGGVFATEWTEEAIKIWFFPRGSIPADITAGTPAPYGSDSSPSFDGAPYANATASASGWGTPNAAFAGTFSPSMDSHFCELQLIVDTTFCGDWAGRVWASDPMCSVLAPTCEDYVSNNPAAFAEAYWLINLLQVFQQTGTDNTDTSKKSHRGKRRPVTK